VKTFTEKPNLELAKTFISSGEFLWNAGIFVWQVKNIIIAFEKYLPEVYDLFASQKEKFNTPDEEAALLEIYPFSTSISIDFGIMEKADNVYVIPSSFGWSDLGTWNSAYENLHKDTKANAVTSNNVMLMDTGNCIVHTPENKLVVLQGLDNFIVVDTGDVLLVCRKEKEQEIKEFVGDVKRQKGDKFL
jgi:mannose-1-phosphate guanylyltransferase